jgi:hypothetical protein
MSRPTAASRDGYIAANSGSDNGGAAIGGRGPAFARCGGLAG